jgi:hypothetical protein
MIEMKRTTSKQKWKNIVSYITAVRDCMDGKTDEEQLKLEKEMYEWLEQNYQINWNQRTLKNLNK